MKKMATSISKRLVNKVWPLLAGDSPASTFLTITKESRKCVLTILGKKSSLKKVISNNIDIFHFELKANSAFKQASKNVPQF